MGMEPASPPVVRFIKVQACHQFQDYFSRVAGIKSPFLHDSKRKGVDREEGRGIIPNGRQEEATEQGETPRDDLTAE